MNFIRLWNGSHQVPISTLQAMTENMKRDLEVPFVLNSRGAYELRVLDEVKEKTRGGKTLWSFILSSPLANSGVVSSYATGSFSAVGAVTACPELEHTWKETLGGAFGRKKSSGFL